MNNLELQDLYSKSNHEVAAELGDRFRKYRIALRLTQKDVAEKSGISVITLGRFEGGHASSISLAHFIALLRVIGQMERIVEAIPEIPDSLYKKPQSARRVRRKKNEE
jgi:transcriptional regulator with XRE-family HTH domain